MLTIHPDPLPVEPVRDLLGITRLLWLAWHKRRPRDGQKLEQAGKRLMTALKLAKDHEPGTMGHSGAWNQVDLAIETLQDVVTELDELRPVLETAADWIRRSK